MARSYACRSLYQNFPLAGKNELAGAVLEALTKDNRNSFPVVSYAPTPVLALVPAFTLVSANLMAKYSKQKLQLFLKICIEAKHQLKKLHKRFFKAQFSDLYKANFYINRSYFLQ